MLYLRQNQHESLCVLQVSPAVLDLPNVVVTDGNAASGYARFAPAPAGLAIVDRDRVFAEYWAHPDEIEQMRRKVAKCAEVLVPDRVAPELIVGAYVSGDVARRALATAAPGFAVVVDGHLFFR
jgi:hypothetical protein